MAKKDYSKGDGTAFANMATVTPVLRKIINRRSGKRIPTESWVNVRDYTLWKSTPRRYGGGMDRISGIPHRVVSESISEYENTPITRRKTSKK